MTEKENLYAILKNDRFPRKYRLLISNSFLFDILLHWKELIYRNPKLEILFLTYCPIIHLILSPHLIEDEPKEIRIFLDLVIPSVRNSLYLFVQTDHSWGILLKLHCYQKSSHGKDKKILL